MGWRGVLEGMTIGSILGGTPGTILGALWGDARENANAAAGANELLIEKTRRCYHAFFQCLGCLAGNDANRVIFARDILQVWNFGDNLTNELMEQFDAGRRSGGRFAALARVFNQTADALGDFNCKVNATKLFCIFIPVDKPGSAELKDLENAGKILGTSSIVDLFKNKYYIYNRRDGIPELPLEDSYSILGTSPSASEYEIKCAFRQKSFRMPRSKVYGIGISDEFTESAVMHFSNTVRAYKSICRARRIK